MAKKIKILQFPIANSNGGITHYALNNWKWLDKNKFVCDFATMSKILDFEERILATGSKVYHISCYAEENSSCFIEEFSKILDQRYDIVHLHTKQWKSFLLEELCKKYHVAKVIVHSHNTSIDTSDKEKREYEIALHKKMKQKFTIDLATDFWACSRVASEFLFGGQIPLNKIKIMPNAIELERFAVNQETRDRYRKKYGLEGCYVIGHVGRFEYLKNHEFLIKVFSKISRQKEFVRLVLLGDGKLYEEMQAKTKMLGMENKILFIGKREDVSCWYQVMDIFCLPSKFEGLGISLIEAQAAGLPCIASDAVPDEAAITEEVLRVQLDIELWESKILEMILKHRNKSRIVRGIDNKMKLQMAGYDIHSQIKNVEEEYLK